MEIILNVAWALCSLGLILLWVGFGVRAEEDGIGGVSLRTSVLALAMVVLLLLPVISLSDDLVAAQGPAETDSCVRRAAQLDQAHASVVPAAIALPEQYFAGMSVHGFSQEVLESYRLIAPPRLVTPDLDSRPPPPVG